MNKNYNILDDLKSRKILVIVESPAKVAHIKEYLSKAGYKVTVMASAGHILELQNDSKSYQNTGVYPEKNFDLNIKISDEKKEIANKLKLAAKGADIIMIGTDGDREGEVIGWSLINLLDLPKTKCFRMITHEITPKAVVHALEHPVPFNNDLVEAGLARLALDKMTGFSLSPIAKTYVGAKSVGRCQSVGLKLICDREKEIQNFKPEKYFDLYLKFTKNKSEFKAKYIGTMTEAMEHLVSEAQIDKIKANCTKDYIIADVDQKVKLESPKPPFTTATIQQEASAKLGLGVKEIMSICQKNFEAGYTTYHRVDSDSLSAEFVTELEKYIKTNYGKNSFVNPRQGKKADNAQDGHEALRVTDLNFTPEIAKDKLPDKQYKVYKLIWQRTVAAALPNAEISETTYVIENNKELFSLVSKEVVKEGYRTVYSYKDDETNDDEGLVKETFAKGEKLHVI